MRDPTRGELMALAAHWDALALEAAEKGLSKKMTGYPPGWWFGIQAAYQSAAAEIRELLIEGLEAGEDYGEDVFGSS